MSAWAEIQRLASDLQRVQLTEAAKKLSEANCIEVITKLIERQLIDVVFTKDGSAYITRKHLRTEIRNECLALGGRVALTELSSALNVDFEHIEAAVAVIVEEDGDEFLLNNGELFATEYVNKLQGELRVLLAEEGVRSQPSLCRQWNLPTELLRSLLLDHLPANGEFVVDGENIYTRDYLDAHKLMLRAILSAITKVTLVSALQQRVSLPTARFFAALDELMADGDVPGKIVGSRNSPSATYVPNIHGQLLGAAIKRMLAQNEYIQIVEVKKLGVADVPAALQTSLPASEFATLAFLPTIVLPKEHVNAQIKAIQDEVGKSRFADVGAVLANSGLPFESEDCDHFVNAVIKANKEWHTDGSFVFTKDLLAKALEGLSEKLEKRATEELEKMEQRKKNPQQAVKEKDDWDEGKGGGKGKKGKSGKGGNKGGGGGKSRADDDSEASGSTVVLNAEQVSDWLRERHVVPEDLVDIVAEALVDSAIASIRERLARLIATQATASAQTNKRSHQQMEQQVAQLYANVCMFETALEQLPSNVQPELRTHLQKTLCTEVAHAVLSYASSTPNVAQMKEKQREETITSLPARIQDVVSALYSSLKADSLQPFHDAIFEVSAPSTLSLNLKSPDKKTKTELASTYASDLLKQATELEDPAAILLSTVLYLYAKDGTPVHASGKFVSQLVPCLAQKVDIEIYDLLVDTQKLVVASLKSKDDAEIKTQLADKIAGLRRKIAN